MGKEPVEYWESRLLEACDIGRDVMLRRDGGEVIRGGSAGWLGFGGEDAAAGGEVAGEEVVDITTVIDMPQKTSQATVVRSGAHGRATAEGWGPSVAARARGGSKMTGRDSGSRGEIETGEARTRCDACAEEGDA